MTRADGVFAGAQWRKPEIAPHCGEAVLPTLRVIGLTCRRGGQVLFAGIEFDVLPAHIVWLRGGNGSGKTTLLRAAAGLVRPDTGRVLWGDCAVHESASYRDGLVYIGHANALKDELSVEEALCFLARIHRRDASAKSLQRALELFGLAERRHTPVRALSQGQRRRVALSRLALDSRPSLWILDEPYDALDDDGCERLDALLESHRSRGGSVLLASHRPPANAAKPALELTRR